MPSFSNFVSETQQTNNVPVGGTPFSLVSGANYVVPSGMTLVITQIVQTALPPQGNTNPEYYYYHGSIFSINGNPIAVFNPSTQFVNNASTAVSLVYSQTISLNLVFSENQNISLSGISKTNINTSTVIPTGYISGYLVKNSSKEKKQTDFLEVSSLLWASGILSTVRSRSTETPANVVFLGDDTSGSNATHRFALVLPNNILDKDAYVFNIETGTQTSVYTGTEKFNFEGYGGLMACWDSNYNGSGKTKLRVIAHPHNGYNNLVSNNILLISVTKDTSSVVEDDFKVENLGAKIPRLNSVMSLTAADGTYNAVLGFAGSDHVVVARPSLTTNQAKLASYDISGVLTTQTAVTSTAFTLSNRIQISYYSSSSGNLAGYQYTPMLQVTAVRGIQGKLYVSCPHTSNSAFISGNFVAVFDKNGTIASQTLNTYTSILTIPSGLPYNSTSSLNASKPTVGLSSAATGSERLAFYISGISDTTSYSNNYSYRNPVIGNYSFNASSAPTLTQVPPTVSTATSNYSFQTTFPSTATTVAPANLVFNSWWASKALTPVNKHASNALIPLTAEEFYNQPDLWHNTVNQWLRTTGILTGTVNHFYVPDGIFVQRRTLTNLGSLSASPVLNTAISNPVAAYCSANYVLVVGVDGSWERISEV